MSRRIRWFRLAAGLLGVVAFLDPLPAIESPSRPDPELQHLLARIERVQSLYLAETLHITCVETITRSGSSAGGGPRREAFHYVYERDDKHGLGDYRVLPGNPYEKRTPKGLHLYNAYVWVFLFHPESAGPAHFDYRALGEDVVELHPSGQPVERIRAVKVQFDPVPPILPDLNDWYGVAWVDPTDAQLLKVWAVRYRDRGRYRAFQMDATDPSRELPNEGYRFREFTTEFSTVKNRMRFPRTVLIRDTRYTIRDKGGKRETRETVLGTVEQTYGSCAFPGVETEERIRDLLASPQK